MNEEKYLFDCPACSATLSVPLSLAGVSGPCPFCQANVLAPFPVMPGQADALPTVHTPLDGPSVEPFPNLSLPSDVDEIWKEMESAQPLQFTETPAEPAALDQPAAEDIQVQPPAAIATEEAGANRGVLIKWGFAAAAAILLCFSAFFFLPQILGQKNKNGDKVGEVKPGPLPAAAKPSQQRDPEGQAPATPGVGEGHEVSQPEPKHVVQEEVKGSENEHGEGIGPTKTPEVDTGPQPEPEVRNAVEVVEPPPNNSTASGEQNGPPPKALASESPDAEPPLPQEDPPPPLAAPTPVSAGRLAAPRQALEGFLNAPSWKERAAFVQESGRMKPIMEAYYKARPDGPQKPDSISYERSQDIPETGRQAYIFTLAYEYSEGVITFPVQVEEMEEGCRVDWRSFVEFRDQHLAKFFKDPTQPPRSFYVHLHRTHYFGSEMPDADKKIYFDVRAPLEGSEGFAWVDEGSDVAKKLGRKADWGVDSHPVVKLQWIQGKTGPPHVAVVDVVAESWRMGDIPDEIKLAVP